MKPGGGRAKGISYEQVIARLFRPLFPGAKRGQLQTRNGSALEDGKADVEGTPYWVECEHAQRSNPNKKLRQAASSTDGRLCVTVTRKSRERPSVDVASMYVAEFLLLARDVEVLRVLRRTLPPEVLAAAREEVDARGRLPPALDADE